MGATPERLQRVYRRSYSSSDAPAERVRTMVDDDDRAAYRNDGRRLVTALVAHLDADPNDGLARGAAEADAEALVDDLARRLAAAHVSLTEAVPGRALRPGSPADPRPGPPRRAL